MAVSCLALAAGTVAATAGGQWEAGVWGRGARGESALKLWNTH